MLTPDSVSERPSIPSQKSAFTRARGATGDFLRRVWMKADQDQIFFMAGAIAFNVLVAVIPLALAAIGVAGFFLQAQAGAQGTSAAEPVVEWLLRVLPEPSRAFRRDMEGYLNDFIASASGLFTIGTLVFAWLATRLIGTLRTALREIFDIQQDRSIVAGKIFDMQMVFVAGILLTINIATTVTLGIITEYGFNVLRFAPSQESFAQNLIFTAVSFITIWLLFVLIYRYLPARRIQWSTAITAATFTSVTFELMKTGFTWYFARVAQMSTYGTLASIAIVVLWVYYMAIAFILGGEVGQVAAMQRVRRQQKERLS